MLMLNWQAWHTSAIGVIGFATKDAKMVYDALYGERGLWLLAKQW